MTKTNRNILNNILIDLGVDIIGGIFYSAGIYTFAAANDFSSGGVSGIAIVLNHLFPAMPIGVLTILLNIPLAILGFAKLGKVFFAKTVKSLIVLSLITDLVMPLFPVYTGNPLLAALACGLCLGVGMALIFRRGSSTGGTDFLTLTLKKRFPHLNVGYILIIEDAVIITVSALVFGNFDAALYGAIAVYAGSRTIDKILYGFDSGAVLFIVTDHAEAISKEIANVIDRSSTLVPAKGAYSGLDKTVLMVVVRKNQIIYVKRAIRKYDETAFVTALEATEILGEGFKAHHD